MPIVTLHLRRDAYDENDRLIPAFAEDVDLDTLTPRARALAEAITQCPSQRPSQILLQSDAMLADRLPGGDRYAQHRSTQHTQFGRTDWWRLRSTDPRTATQWLEIEARDKVPLGWHILGITPDNPVPSLLAGAADQYLTRDGVLEYLRARGVGMSDTAWDTFRGTDHFPAPDRYVCRRPQWLPETVDAYIDRPRELWPISRVAEHLGYSGPSATGSARKTLYRWGLSAVSRAPGRGGESLYDADQVRAAHAARPGRGTRTDLRDAASA